MSRYFIVTYAHSTGHGQCESVTNGTYPSLDKLRKDISEHVTEPIILNIMELSESDYKDYTS